MASFLAQYLASKGKEVRCVDTDPVNASLKEIKGLDVTTLELFKGSTDEVDFRALDALVNRLVEEPGTYVVDNGAASFKPMVAYLFDSGILETLAEGGVSVFFHTIIATGPELAQTIAGAESIIGALHGRSDVSVILWVNEHNGPIESFTDGASLRDTQFYSDNRSAIAGLIEVPYQTRAAADNLATLLKRQLTFELAMQDEAFFLVEKSRLKQFRTGLFQAIESAGIV